METQTTTAAASVSTAVGMTPEGKDMFKKAVRLVITDWSALKLAIENGMGGNEAREKLEWMCDVVTQAILKDKYIDIAGYIEAILDNEFDTHIEDGSIDTTVYWIGRFYKDCLEGKYDRVVNSLEATKVSKSKIPQVLNICESGATSDSSAELEA